MDPFRGKKVVCFLALPHHSRFLLPVMEGLRQRGMEVKFFTAAAEAAFEITLLDAGVPYTHSLDYITEEIRDRTNAAFRKLRPLWVEKVFDHEVLQLVPLPIQDKVIRNAVEDVFCFGRMLEVEKFYLHPTLP